MMREDDEHLDPLVSDDNELQTTSHEINFNHSGIGYSEYCSHIPKDYEYHLLAPDLMHCYDYR